MHVFDIQEKAAQKQIKKEIREAAKKSLDVSNWTKGVLNGEQRFSGVVRLLSPNAPNYVSTMHSKPCEMVSAQLYAFTAKNCEELHDVLLASFPYVTWLIPLLCKVMCMYVIR